MAIMDVFNSEPFSLVALTDAINNIEFVPGRIDELGLFTVTRTDQRIIAIEQRDDVIALVPPTARGGPGTTMGTGSRTLRNLNIPHFELDGGITADQVQSVRAFGSESEMMSIGAKVRQVQEEHVNSFAMTEEHARLGAIKGVITYADSSSLDLFSEFGVAQETEVDFDLDNANPAAGALRKKCAGVIRTIADNLGGLPFFGVHAFCGNTFFDDLIAHSEVRNTFLNWSDAQSLRTAYVGGAGRSYGVFEFGGITWENYRGSYQGTPFVDATKCHIFPLGVPGLFRTVYGPADYPETVNTMGRRLYSKIRPTENQKGYHVDDQMNALQYCTRPKVLIKGKNT